MIPQWRPEIWLALATTFATFIIAGASIAQWWVAHRIRRPKVEVFVRLRKEVSTLTSAGFTAEVANLSSVGIWMEALDATFDVSKCPSADNTGSAAIESILPAFTDARIPCHELIVQAGPADSDPDGTKHGDVRIRLRYRVHEKWHETRWGQYAVSYGAFDVQGIRPL
jgi:hypothetical protein